MLFVLLFALALALASAEEALRYNQIASGILYKTTSAIERINLPHQVLNFIQIHVVLTDLDYQNSDLKPWLYARFNGIPTESSHDYSQGFSGGISTVSQIFPKFSEFLMIRIDGGMLDRLHYNNAKIVRGWHYRISVTAGYCPSGSSTVKAWSYSILNKTCDVRISDIQNLGLGSVASKVFVPIGSSILKIITTGTYSLSYNSLEYIQISGEHVIKNPNQGYWYITAENLTTGLKVELQKRDDFEKVYKYLPEVPRFYQISQGIGSNYLFNQSEVHLVTEVLENDLKFRFAIKLQSEDMDNIEVFFGINGVNNQNSVCKDKLLYCKRSKNELVAEIGYMPAGFLYVSVNSNSSNYYSLSLFSTVIGNDFCNNQPCSFNGLSYLCDCQQNTAGFYCEQKAISDELYMFSVLFLTCSNFSMIFAILFGIKIRAYVEVTAFSANMIASFVYHMCDVKYNCFGFSEYTLRVIDFILSFYSIYVGLIFLAKIENLKAKSAILLSILFGLLYLGFGNEFSVFESSVLPLIMTGTIVIGNYFYFTYKKSIEHYSSFRLSSLKTFFLKSGNFYFRFTGLAVFFLALALISRASGTNENYYWVRNRKTHSLWHIFVMFSAFFVLKSVNSETDGLSFTPQSRLIESRGLTEMIEIQSYSK